MKFRRITALSMAAAMALSAGVMAGAVELPTNVLADSIAVTASNLESGHKNVTVNGHTYEIYSTLYQETKPRSTAWVVEKNHTNVNANWLGVMPAIYDSNENRLENTKMSYNTTKNYFHFLGTSSVRFPSDADFVYASGTVDIYNGAGYTSYDVPQSPRYTGQSLAAIKNDQLDENGNYFKNDLGHTYGSELDAATVGEKPYLISAVGQKGVTGYVKADELYPNVTTPEEAAKYMETVEEDSYIPLYDVNENVIGSFCLYGVDLDAQVID